MPCVPRLELLVYTDNMLIKAFCTTNARFDGNAAKCESSPYLRIYTTEKPEVKKVLANSYFYTKLTSLIALGLTMLKDFCYAGGCLRFDMERSLELVVLILVVSCKP